MFAVTYLQEVPTVNCNVGQAAQIRQHPIQLLQEASTLYSSTTSSQLLQLKDVIIFLAFWKCQSVLTGRQPAITLTTFLEDISHKVGSWRLEILHV